MYCPNCGSKYDSPVKFCGTCGYAFEEEYQIQPVTKVSEKRKKKGIYILSGLIILIAAVIAIFLGMQGKKEKEYKGYLSAAEKYIKELDYEQAEASYLQAIKIAPKEKEPYVKLAKLYMEQGEEEKAEEIIKEAEKAGAKGDKKVHEEEENLEQDLEERKDVIDYRWVVEPTIDADDIYYVADYNSYGEYWGDESINNNYKQMMSEYAVIKNGNTLGLIDYNGIMKGDMDYKKIFSFEGTYNMERITPQWSNEFGMEWDYYLLVDDEIVAELGIGDMATPAFYYCGGLHEIHENEEWINNPSDPQNAIPVKKSDVIYVEDGNYRNYEWWGNLSGKYGIYFQGEMKTDFMYEQCGSESDGLLAVCKDGKWGYVNSEGTEIIPIEYDASWTQFKGEQNFMYKGIEEYCYSASDGYVVLCKNGMWELRDVTGKLAIPTGEFEEICPVYEGKCWVKQDGKWGVIRLSDSYLATEEEITEKAVTENTVEQSVLGEATDIAEWERELQHTEEKSKELEEKLENAMTQDLLNQYSRELYVLWDDEINVLWKHLKSMLSESEMENLTKIQREWIKEKESKVEEAGKEWEGGSGQPMAENMVAWEMTEERVYELVEYLR